MLGKIFAELFRFSEELPKFTPLEYIYALVTLKPYYIIRNRVLAEAKKHESVYGDRWRYARELAPKLEEGEIFLISDLQVILEKLYALPIEYAISVIDILIYVNKSLWSKLINEVLPLMAHRDQTALDLLSLHLVICCQNPDLAFNSPEPLQGMLIQNLREKFGIKLVVDTKLPWPLLKVLFYLLMLLPLAGVAIVFLHLQFFFGSALGLGCFVLLFLSSYWFERLTKFILRLMQNKARVMK